MPDTISLPVCTDDIRMDASSLVLTKLGLKAGPPPPAGAVIPVSNTLPSLKNAQSLVAGFYNRFDYEFDGFPKTIQVVRDGMTLRNLSTSDLSFLSNLVCAPKLTRISDNAHLTFLSGLRAYFSFPTVKTLDVGGNPQLLRSGYQPLGPVLQCDGASSSLTLQSFSAEVNDCLGSNPNPITSINGFCSYLVNPCA